MTQDEQGRWKIKREVSLGDLIALLIAIATVLAVYARLDTRVTIVELTAANNSTAISQNTTEIKASLNRLNDKIDRLIERVK